MTNRLFRIFIVLLHTFIFCQSQVVNYECNFNDALTGDCQFTQTAGPNIVLDPGAYPNANPRQPYSDVSAILLLTKPNNEPCVLPYPYPPAGTWQMHFCRRNFNGTFTCPTASSSGQCVAGKYGVIKITNTGSQDYTYIANVQRSSNTVQCLDFYYYITDTSENAKMQVGWESNDDLDDIVEVTAVPLENKWQHIQRSFTLSSSLSSYKIVFGIVRDTGIANFFFALDEIKIYDQSCDSLPTTTVPTTTTPVIVTSTTTTTTTTTTTILPDITTAERSTTPVISTAISTQSSKPDETTSTKNTPVVQSITTTTTTASSQSTATTVSFEETSSTKTPTETTTTTTESLILTSTTTTTISTPTTTSTVITTTITTTITAEPLTRIFSCDFSTKLCFEDSEVRITNGTEFTPIDISEPPRAPLSDVSSIYQPTTNTEICKLPYQLSIDNSTNATNWNMWFCYNNQCPTESEQLSTCTSGNYGLIPLDPWESNKTISSSISPSIMIRDSTQKQCLLYYYYFTVYDDVDWGQQLSISIRSDNETNNAVEIDRLSVAEMIDNRWQKRNVTFNSTFTNYTLIFTFEVTNANRTEDASLNKTIYFALDNIDVYNRNCDDVIDPLTTAITISTTSATPTPTTTLTTTTGNETTIGISSTSSGNLGLILGLALGVGIPVSLAFIGGIVYYFKIIKPKHRVIVNNSTATITTIPMTPMSASTNENATVAAVVA